MRSGVRSPLGPTERDAPPQRRTTLDSPPGEDSQLNELRTFVSEADNRPTRGVGICPGWEAPRILGALPDTLPNSWTACRSRIAGLKLPGPRPRSSRVAPAHPSSCCTGSGIRRGMGLRPSEAGEQPSGRRSRSAGSRSFGAGEHRVGRRLDRGMAPTTDRSDVRRASHARRSLIGGRHRRPLPRSLTRT